MDNPDAHSPELLKHVVGYDPDVFVHMGFAAPDHSQNDDRRFRSHLSTHRHADGRQDHHDAGAEGPPLGGRDAGAEEHVARDEQQRGPQSTCRAWPTATRLARPGVRRAEPVQHVHPDGGESAGLRQKATLHILDGLIGVYEGGPGSWNKTWGTWRANGLFFATDPVAMDHVGWDIIDAKRVSLGLPRVGEIGRRDFTPAAAGRA